MKLLHVSRLQDSSCRQTKHPSEFLIEKFLTKLKTLINDCCIDLRAHGDFLY